jgi:hypothetical protein
VLLYSSFVERERERESSGVEVSRYLLSGLVSLSFSLFFLKEKEKKVDFKTFTFTNNFKKKVFKGSHLNYILERHKIHSYKFIQKKSMSSSYYADLTFDQVLDDLQAYVFLGFIIVLRDNKGSHHGNSLVRPG